MTKSEFLLNLKVELAGLPQSEIDDILRDQEELIRDAVAAGRTEESIIASLGGATELARNLKAEIKIEKAQEEKHISGKIKGVLGAAGAVLVLAPFGGWATAGVLTAVFICATLACFGLAAIFPFTFVGSLGLGFGFLGGVFLGFAGLGFMYFVTMLVAHLVLKYLKWNLNFVKKQATSN